MHPVSVASPRIVRPPNYAARALLLLSLLTLLALAIGAAYFAGTHVERESTQPLLDTMRVSEREREALLAEVGELKRQAVLLERSVQIDRDASRSVSKQLKAAQDERLAAQKEVSFLRRLIQEDGGGILQPKDFKLKAIEQSDEFQYSLTIQQLIQDFGESTGTVGITVIGTRDGKEVSLPLADLAGSEPASHKLKFKHFQVIEGTIRLPDNLEPKNLVVEIKPNTDKLIPVSETFAWNAEQ